MTSTQQSTDPFDEPMAHSLPGDEQSSPQGLERTDPAGAQNNYDRRREQVRRAQKKHRERKENHCRMLEDELHRLYNLITMDEELQNLRFENEILRDIMLRHSVPLPAGVPLLGASWAQVTFTNNGGCDQRLQVKLPGCSLSVAPQDGNSSGLDEYTSIEGGSAVIQSTLHSAKCADISDSKYNHSSTNLAQMGVDFVLSIERPCLFHTRAPSTEEPSGHALSMQGILLSGAPRDLHDHTTWEVPSRQLEKLFELAGSLGLDGYITPVQAWNRIVGRLDVARIFDTRLEELRAAMIPHIKCYGFGALIEEDVFEDLFQIVFGE